MRTHRDAVELAKICAFNARIATTKEVAAELWRLAKQYVAEAGELDGSKQPDLGDLPLWLK